MRHLQRKAPHIHADPSGIVAAQEVLDTEGLVFATDASGEFTSDPRLRRFGVSVVALRKTGHVCRSWCLFASTLSPNSRRKSVSGTPTMNEKWDEHRRTKDLAAARVARH